MNDIFMKTAHVSGNIFFHLIPALTLKTEPVPLINCVFTTCAVSVESFYHDSVVECYPLTKSRWAERCEGMCYLV